MLSLLYQAVRRGELAKSDAEDRLDYLRGLRIRLLGDRVLQRTAWKVANQLGWEDTFDAEYVALTQLQADAFVTLDVELARAVEGLVTLAAPDELLAPAVNASRTQQQRPTQPPGAPSEGTVHTLKQKPL